MNKLTAEHTALLVMDLQQDILAMLGDRAGPLVDRAAGVILRAKRIDTLVLLGISTSGVILSTVRHGFDADYRLVVVEDCCADGDDEVHRVLTTKVFPRQATVVPATELIAALG